MARAIEKIEQDIAALEEATSAIAQEFYKTYERYLNGLGQAMRQQLILATYHLCTQAYPQAFLSLSFSQRQQLQKAIRKLAENAKQQLLEVLHPPKSGLLAHLPTHDTNFDELVSRLFGKRTESAPSPEAEEKTAQKESEEREEKESSPSLSLLPLNSGENLSFVSENLVANALSVANSQSPITKPDELAFWQEKLEGAIAKIIQKVSRDSNRLLQQSGILPKKLPEPVLEAAAKVEASGESVPGPPNLLNLVIETQDDSAADKLGEQESESSTLIQLTAIHLRLSEIEFTDPKVATVRHQIRSLSAKLNNLGRDYHKKQREKSIAEAEGAWRVSWFDE
ncbi:hypothetical protein [Aerosakkonema funiforme]|uniref:hypothetical protein n=1 Tax=Aerosakkonema funiforme TaxID=1246630 RepID=UPI0035B9ABF7